MITDITTGFIGVRINKETKEVFNELESTGYCVDIEIKARALEKGLVIEEIPIDTIYINKVKGTTVFDGINMALFMIRLKFALLLNKIRKSRH